MLPGWMRDVIVVLGGTTEGRKLAQGLAATGMDYVVSLAGRTTLELPEHTRVGGFGGVAGLVTFLRDHRVRAVIDATHPFAARMQRHAVEACRIAEVPLVRFSRPGWRKHPLAHTWTWVNSHADAVAALHDTDRVLLTVGRQEAAQYACHPGPVIVRVAEASQEWRDTIPAQWTVLQARGPFDVEAERQLLAEVDVLVSKDSGGTFNEAKLEAAHERDVRVVMIARPDVPHVPHVASVNEALAWAAAHANPKAAT